MEIDDKALLRRQALKKRNAMSKSEIESKSELIAKRLMTLPVFEQGGRIFGYFNTGSEVVTRQLLKKLITAGRTVCLPVALEDYSMEFYEVRDLEAEVSEGYKGILEPSGRALTRQLHPAGGDIMIIPGVAFGRDMYRLGYGKGFYDRYLARYPQVYKAAPAFMLQLYESVFPGPEDVSMDCIITEEGILWADPDRRQ